MCPSMLSELLGRKEARQRDSLPEAEMKGQHGPWQKPGQTAME